MEGQGPMKSRQPALRIGANSHDLQSRQMRNVQALIRVFLLQKKIKRIKEKIKKIKKIKK
jgi:hypothetical protein